MFLVAEVPLRTPRTQRSWPTRPVVAVVLLAATFAVAPALTLAQSEPFHALPGDVATTSGSTIQRLLEPTRNDLTDFGSGPRMTPRGMPRASFGPGATMQPGLPAPHTPLPFQPEPGFYRKHWLPRVERQVGRLTPIFDRPEREMPVTQYVIHDQVTEAASRRLRSATGGALRELVLDTPAMRKVTSIRLGRRRSASPVNDDGPVQARPNRRSARLDLRLSTTESRISVGVPGVASGFMRFSVGTSGSLGFSLAGVRRSNSAFVANYDPREERIQVGCRLQF